MDFDKCTKKKTKRGKLPLKVIAWGILISMKSELSIKLKILKQDVRYAYSSVYSSTKALCNKHSKHCLSNVLQCKRFNLT